ncbi:MAG: ATP-binding protein [Desulfovibrionaceae bacterium]|nr:ATP-binding protein [Desulfovibrionaceae bacterium]
MKRSLRLHLSQTCSDRELRQWFDPLVLSVDEEGHSIAISFPHAYFASWFEDNARERFEEQLARFLGPGYVLHYAGTNGNGRTGAPEPTRPATLDYPFGRQFTFDRFFTNRKNYFPLASAREVARNETIQYNPFVICGGNGTGKTHLMRSIANEISRRAGRESIFFSTMEELVDLYRMAHAGDVFKARAHVCSHALLMLDDFQMVRDYEDVQEELIFLFNHFYDNGKQMIFGCADKVTSYGFLHPKLKSRLEWGLIVNLKDPDLDIRVQYIEHQCRLKHIQITREQMLTLARRFDDFRFLQGILLKLTAFRELVQKDIKDKDFEHILSHTEHRPGARLSPEKVIVTVAEHFGVPVKELTGVKRHRNIVLARQVAMFLCRELISCSYPSLGKLFGGKDHSTAMYAIKKIKSMQQNDKDLKTVVTTLKKTCLSLEEN